MERAEREVQREAAAGEVRWIWLSTAALAALAVASLWTQAPLERVAVALAATASSGFTAVHASDRSGRRVPRAVRVVLALILGASLVMLGLMLRRGFKW